MHDIPIMTQECVDHVYLAASKHLHTSYGQQKTRQSSENLYCFYIFYIVRMIDDMWHMHMKYVNICFIQYIFTYYTTVV